MATYRQAFSLTKEELREATPPGTVRLVGKTEAEAVATRHDASANGYNRQRARPDRFWSS